MNGRPVVIDTNCLVQMISKHSPYRKIWDAFLGKRFVLCVTNEILEEYPRMLCPEIAENVVLLLINQANVKFVDPRFRTRLITADPDDDKFVDCAFAAGADIIVSEDSHFKVLNNTSFPYIHVVTMDEFINMYNL